MFKKYILIFIIALISAVLAGLVYFYLHQSQAKPLPDEARQSTTSQKRASIPTPTSRPELSASALQSKSLEEQYNYYLDTYQFQKARDILQRLPDTQLKNYRQVLFSSFTEQPPTTRKKIKKLLDSDNLDPQIIAYLQNILAAYDEFDTFQAGKPEHLAVLLAESYLNNSEARFAIAKASEALAKNSNYTDAWIAKGLGHILLTEYDDAISALEHVVPSDNPDLNFYLGLAYFHTKNYNKAIKFLEFTAKQPLSDDNTTLGYNSNRLHDLLVQAYDYTASYQKEASLLETILQNPDQPIEKFTKPIYLYIQKLQEPKKALQLAQKALQSHPTSALAYNLVGWAHVANHDLTEAKTSLDKALEIDPDLAAAYLNLGHLYRQKKDLKKARQYYEHALNLDPNSSIGKSASAELANF